MSKGVYILVDHDEGKRYGPLTAREIAKQFHIPKKLIWQNVGTGRLFRNRYEVKRRANMDYGRFTEIWSSNFKNEWYKMQKMFGVYKE